MRRQWTLADVTAVGVIGLLFISLLSLGIRRQRGVARRGSCENNLKQIGIAFHNYHSAYKQLPMGSGGTTGAGQDNSGQANPAAGNAGRLSAWVGITPFMEQQRLWEQISNPMKSGSQTFPSMGPVPWYDAEIYTPWASRPEALVCPEENAATKSLASSYVLNYGDGVYKVFYGKGDWPSPNDSKSAMMARASQRGMFARQQVLKFRDVLDGLSNTLMLAESKMVGPTVAKDVAGLAFNPSLAISAQQGDQFWPVGRDAVWCDGLLRSSGFQTILPPGSPSATSDDGDQSAVISASSHHGSGTHVVFADGAVRFVTGSIDAGDPTAPSIGLLPTETDQRLGVPGSKSPYGLWGALGSRASRETIEMDLDGGVSSITAPRRTLTDLELQSVRKNPIRTWTAAGGRGTMKGWLVSCSKRGDVALVNESGDVKRVTLSDLTGEDAYFIVESLLAEKLAARDVLAAQLEEAVGLLERKEFNKFMTTFLDASQMSLRDMTQASSSVYQQRGLLIQSFDDAIALLRSNQVQIQSVDDRLVVEFGRNRGVGLPLRMRYSDGRWYVFDK